VLQVSILANNGIYEKIKEEMQMCEALERLMKNELDAKEAAGIAKGREEGRAEGRAEGRTEGKENASLFHIRNLMESMNLTAEQAMDALQIPPEEQKIYAVKLKMNLSH
jgi:predicted transposase YdaD